MPEDIDPSVWQQASIFADVHPFGGVADDREVGADGQVPAAGSGALVNDFAAVHVPAKSLGQAIIKRNVYVVNPLTDDELIGGRQDWRGRRPRSLLRREECKSA